MELLSAWESAHIVVKVVVVLFAAMVLGALLAVWTAPGLGCRLENLVRAVPAQCGP